MRLRNTWEGRIVWPTISANHICSQHPEFTVAHTGERTGSPNRWWHPLLRGIEAEVAAPRRGNRSAGWKLGSRPFWFEFLKHSAFLSRQISHLKESHRQLVGLPRPRPGPVRTGNDLKGGLDPRLNTPLLISLPSTSVAKRVIVIVVVFSPPPHLKPDGAYPNPGEVGGWFLLAAER